MAKDYGKLNRLIARNPKLKDELEEALADIDATPPERTADSVVAEIAEAVKEGISKVAVNLGASMAKQYFDDLSRFYPTPEALDTKLRPLLTVTVTTAVDSTVSSLTTRFVETAERNRVQAEQQAKIDARIARKKAEGLIPK